MVKLVSAKGYAAGPIPMSSAQEGMLYEVVDNLYTGSIIFKVPHSDKIVAISPTRPGFQTWNKAECGLQVVPVPDGTIISIEA